MAGLSAADDRPVIRVALHSEPIDGLLGPWAELHAASPWATPFGSAGWARAWWPAFARGGDPFVLVAREGDEVVGLAPLIRRRRGPARMLEGIGIEPGDYWDVLAAPGRREGVTAACLGALAAQGRQWDAWLLRCTPAGSPVAAAVEAAGLRTAAWPMTPAPRIDLPASFDEYLASLSSNRRSNLRKHLRRLDSGEVVLCEVTDPDALPAAVERWQRLRERQWSEAQRTINPAHLSPVFAGFVLAVLRELIPAGQAAMWEFERDGEVIGAYVNFADAHAYHWYLGGFDPRHAKLGVGKIAIGLGIRESIAAGRARYDFGRGAEPYKYWYGAEDALLPALVVGHDSPRSRAALAAATAQRAVLRFRAARAAAPA